MLRYWYICIISEHIRHPHIVNFDQTGKPLDIPTLPSRLFRKMKFTQTDTTGEHYSNNIEDLFGSIWSLKSKISNKSPEPVRTKQLNNNSIRVDLV